MAKKKEVEEKDEAVDPGSPPSPDVTGATEDSKERAEHQPGSDIDSQ